MKTWTVVIEVKTDGAMDRYEVEQRIHAGSEAFEHFVIHETIEAPYGPGEGNVIVKENERRNKPLRTYPGIPR